MKFSNCGQTCGQGHFLTSDKQVGKCCQVYCPKAFRGFRGRRLEPEPHAPKSRALPTALHPVMKFSNCGQIWGQRWILTSVSAKNVPGSSSVPAGHEVAGFPSWMPLVRPPKANLLQPINSLHNVNKNDKDTALIIIPQAFRKSKIYLKVCKKQRDRAVLLHPAVFTVQRPLGGIP